MTDAHCHLSSGDPAVRELLVGRDFAGTHPWESATVDRAAALAGLERRLAAEPRLGVGEIGLDRLKDRTVSPEMRALFEDQLRLAAAYRRPVVLHGAKCWGQVVETIRRLVPSAPSAESIPAFLFHGFSRSDGLIPDIVRLNGYISVGPAVLNDHAVNYRALVRKIPLDRLLVETDRTESSADETPPLADIVAKVAELRGLPVDELARTIENNVSSFLLF